MFLILQSTLCYMLFNDDSFNSLVSHSGVSLNVRNLWTEYGALSEPNLTGVRNKLEFTLNYDEVWSQNNHDVETLQILPIKKKRKICRRDSLGNTGGRWFRACRLPVERRHRGMSSESILKQKINPKDMMLVEWLLEQALKEGWKGLEATIGMGLELQRDFWTWKQLEAAFDSRKYQRGGPFERRPTASLGAKPDGGKEETQKGEERKIDATEFDWRHVWLTSDQASDCSQITCFLHKVGQCDWLQKTTDRSRPA
ncbi:hypothetical protein DFH07DRAFT_773929 [Mycena maculata]|uniref:Uncharacterized protein n=1 Tax=Mycena maculata TaxID=230809 RepID=A0AAD7IZW4_9AGAR|nr:hypothetical protein DFH07DRAFT_773929 [Mycena maculata]